MVDLTAACSYRPAGAGQRGGGAAGPGPGSPATAAGRGGGAGGGNPGAGAGAGARLALGAAREQLICGDAQAFRTACRFKEARPSNRMCNG